MRFQSLDKLEKAYWYSFSDEPIATTSKLRKRLCDPAFLPPEESPDGLWHLFAHTFIGIDHFTSTSGLEWKKTNLVFARAHSPFLYKEGGIYYLLFELHSKVFYLKDDEGKSDESRIFYSTSTDLYSWSDPRVLLYSSDVTKSVYRQGPQRISRPQLVAWNDGYRLYFGAGETKIYDTKQKAAPALMYAQSMDIEGPYEINQKPVMKTEPDSLYRNLATGAVKIVPFSDGLAAFECAYYFDIKKRKSSSALLLFTTRDGSEWEFSRVIQKSASSGWASRYISSVDVRYKKNEDSWYLIYSANSERKIIGKLRLVTESLGLLLGQDKR